MNKSTLLATAKLATPIVALLTCGCGGEPGSDSNDLAATGGASMLSAGTGGGGAVTSSGGETGVLGGTGANSAAGGESAMGTGGDGSGGASTTDCNDVGADAAFSFFVTSWYHIKELSGSEDGFGGDLRYNGAATGLAGADAICQEMASRVCFGERTWKAYLSTSTEDAIDRIGSGPWYDFSGQLVANNPDHLVQDQRPGGGACDNGSYDETGVFHDGKSDVNADGADDDDHDTLTGSNTEGRYAGFSCDDWTSTTATGGGGRNGGVMIGHAWPRNPNSGRNFTSDHSAPGCGAGTNFVQNGGGDGTPIVGGGGGYGGFYCFALPQ